MANQVKAPVIAAELRAAVSPIAVELARVDSAFETGFAAVVDSIARVMGTSPKFDHWNNVHLVFVGEYVNARKCKETTAQNRWTAISKALEEKFGLEKPKKETAESKKKSAQRAKVDKLVKAARAQCPTATDAMKKATELAAQGKANEAKIFREAAISLAKDTEKTASKVAKEKLGKLRDELRDALKACEDERILREALAYLKAKSVTAPAAKRAVRKAPAPTKANA